MTTTVSVEMTMVHWSNGSKETSGKPWNHIAKLSKSLSRTLSLPRKCRICGKMVIFRSFRCRICNYVSHRQCADHADQGSEPNVRSKAIQSESEDPTNNKVVHSVLGTVHRECIHRRDSVPTDSIRQQTAADESFNHKKSQAVSHKQAAGSPWKKVLAGRTNSGNGSSGIQKPSDSSMSPSGGAGGFYKRLVCWLKNRTTLQESGNDHEHDLCEKYMKGKYGLKEQPVRQIACKRLKLALAGAARGWPTPVQRQQQPQHPHSCCCKRDTHPHPQHPRYSDTSGAQSQSPRCSCSKGHIHRDSGISSLASSVAQTPSWECMGTSSTVDHTFVTSSSFSSVCSSKGRGCCHSKHSFSSSSSSSSSSAPYNRDVHPPTTIITTTTTSSSNNKPLPVRLGCCLASPPYNDPHFPIHATVPAGSCSTGVLREQGHDNVAHTVHLFCGQLHDGRFGRRCPSKTRTLSLESKSGPRDDLCATWPPVGRKVFTTNDDAFEGSESGFEDYDVDDESKSLCLQSQSNVKETLGEWSIPFKDLKFGRQVRKGRHHDIYRGRWHGEVMIHIFHTKSEQETTQFWKEVTSLTMIRHENVALFMGVCTDMPQLAIITSVRKGSSLYDHIHIKKDHFPLPYKVQIARQVAQGMSYLHAKGIIHQKLNSKNILLETKVKVSLLDQGMAEKDYDRIDYGCVPKGHLAYVSPEAMKSLRIEPPRIVPTVPYTKQSDVFAFGTILYELFGERWPFQGLRAHSIIWQVASGHLQSLDGLKCSSGIKNLMSECWSKEASCRPTFHHILKVLQQNVLLHRRHSTSEPDNLNRLGFNQGLLPC